MRTGDPATFSCLIDRATGGVRSRIYSRDNDTKLRGSLAIDFRCFRFLVSDTSCWALESSDFETISLYHEQSLQNLLTRC